MRDAEPPEPGHGGPERRDLLALVTTRVRLRFAVTAAAFAERVAGLGAAAAGPAGALAYAARLSLDDLYLAMACARGDESAWNECATREFGFIKDFARRYLREPAASDVADQVIADLWQRGKIAQFDGRSKLRTWLGAVVAHAALNALKAARRTVPLDSSEGEPWRRRRETACGGGQVEDEASEPLRRLVAEALAGLPAEARLLILLHYEQGLTLDEVGVVVGAAKSTLSRRLKRTCADLRAAVDALARTRFGASADVLRAGVDLSRLDFDLSHLVAGEGAERSGPAPV